MDRKTPDCQCQSRVYSLNAAVDQAITPACELAAHANAPPVDPPTVLTCSSLGVAAQNIHQLFFGLRLKHAKTSLHSVPGFSPSPTASDMPDQGAIAIKRGQPRHRSFFALEHTEARCASGGKGENNQAIGRSRGGRTDQNPRSEPMPQASIRTRATTATRSAVRSKVKRGIKCK